MRFSKVQIGTQGFLPLVDNKEVLAVGLAFLRNIFGGKRIDFMVGANALDEKYEYIFYDKLKDYVKKIRLLKIGNKT